MNIRSLLLGVAAAITVSAGASAASASITITDVETANSNGQYGTVTVSGWGQPWTTPILMKDDTGKTFVVFCDDLQHDVYVAGGQSLPYHLGLVKTDGFGNLLGDLSSGPYTPAEEDAAEAISNRMGQLADIGRADYLAGNLKAADAAQAAIWSVEYAEHGWVVSASDPTVQSYLIDYLKVADNGRGWAKGLIADGGTQSQILGAVPEPATWAMFICGLGMIGMVLRRRRSSDLAVSAA